MKNKIFKFLLLILCLTTTTFLYAGKGTSITAANFLTIGMGSRSQAMGGAYTSVSDDIYASYWNQAGLNNIKNKAFTFSHSDYLLDMNIEYFAYAIPYKIKKKNGALSMNLIVMDYGDGSTTTVDDPYGLRSGTYSARDIAFQINYGFSLSSKFALGAGSKIISSKLDDKTARGLAFDIGFLYQLPFNSSLGFTLQNIGPKIKYSSTKEMLPLTARLGLSHSCINNALLISCDIIKEYKMDLSFTTGVEYKINKIFSLRSGYDSSRKIDKDISFGLGINFLK